MITRLLPVSLGYSALPHYPPPQLFLRRRDLSTVAAVTTPLFLRPLSYSATTDDIAAFRRWAHDLLLYSASSISASGGPDQSLLSRELSWFLQDACGPTTSTEAVKLRTDLEELYELWRRRICDRRPLQYLVGCEHWRDLVLVVRDGVLIPRPETELLVDLVAGVEGFANGVWADLGTGSGAVSIGIGRYLGDEGRVLATDVSSDAVDVARFNVERYGLKDKVEVRQGSWFEPLKDFEGKLMGVVSNPPYIPSGDIPGLQAEVVQHEPRLALDGGTDGMDYLLQLCEGSAVALKPGGFFAFETNGDKQSEFIVDYACSNFRDYFDNVKMVADFAGIKRFVTGFHR